jgi:hypothetical protein
MLGMKPFGDERATHCMDEADSGDCIADHISNHGSTSRPAQSATAEECRYPAMSGHRVSPSDEEDWRFGNIRFSMNRREDFDDWQLRDHHWPGQYGYGRNFAAPHSHHFSEWFDR